MVTARLVGMSSWLSVCCKRRQEGRDDGSEWSGLEWSLELVGFFDGRGQGVCTGHYGRSGDHT